MTVAERRWRVANLREDLERRFSLWLDDPREPLTHTAQPDESFDTWDEVVSEYKDEWRGLHRAERELAGKGGRR